MNSGNFQAYSEYYDLLYADKDYRAEAEYVLSLLEKHLHIPNGSILEIGCGTGAHAELFAEKGWTVHGIDLSQSMLARAQRRVSTTLHPDKLTFELGDARTFRARKVFDAAVSLFHVASYQITDADLEAMFQTAAVHLRPGGVFLFDFWYGPAVLTEGPSVRIKRFSNADVSITRIAEPTLEETKNVVEVQYSIFVKKRSGLLVELAEKHRMRYMFLLELERILEKSGFSLEACRGWMEDRTAKLTDWSVSVAAIRKRESRP